jgi:hypothetical protein
MQSNTTQHAVEETGVYRLERVELDRLGPVGLAEWNAFIERNPPPSPMHDPRWLRENYGGPQSGLLLYFLYHGDSLRGIAPFVAKDWPVKCQLGEITLARLPLQRLRLLGGAVQLPDEPAAYEMLVSSLLTREKHFDAIYLDDVDLDSFLWRFVENNPAFRASFVRYMPEPPAPRVLLRLSGSFDDYMGRFSSKHRKNLRREAAIFQALAPEQESVVRYTRPEEVDTFVDRAIEISRKTYQWKLLGLGLRHPDSVRKHLSFLARNGWLRAYLLSSKDTPCAFVIGFQYGGRYYLDDMGYDPEWRQYSVGTILQLEVIKDLFLWNRPEVYDLGEYGSHKEEFATDNYLQGKVFLFRRGVYPGFVRAGHRSCSAMTRAASVLLERYGWKKRLKKIIRTFSSRS